ncbi:hypothetical protein AB0B21_38690 [Streptomyces rimosus]|uniref:hypothetical protein n=1 Tax=Streptomyces rimosus TaxID=1927 RepID=UPI00131AFCAD|nr:hypothetical protein [Streptomyces rimosus]
MVVVAPAVGLDVGGEPAEAGLGRVRGEPVLGALPRQVLLFGCVKSVTSRSFWPLRRSSP